MKNQLLYLAGTIAIALAIMLVAGCEEAVEEAPTPSVDSVDDVTQAFSGTVDPASDFGSAISTPTLTNSVSKADVFDDITAIVEAIKYELDYSATWDTDGSGWDFDTNPPNLFELSEPPSSFSLTATLTDVTPISGMLIDAQGNASVSYSQATDGFGQKYFTRLTGTASVTGVDVTIPSITNIGKADINGGRVVAEANAGLDVIPDYAEVEGSTKPVGGQIAYAVSVAVEVAVSYDNTGNSGYSGNIVISVRYNDEVNLDITQSMVEDGSYETYLEENVGKGTLTIDVTSYSSAGSQLASWSFTVQELIDLGTEEFTGSS